MSNSSGFERLARPLQQVLWQLKWPQLRPIQEQAIVEILDEDADLVISAETAAGKTEAAFLPILSRMFESPTDSVQAVYVGPLKALINDQFGRLERLCHCAEIKVHRWHGDVDAGRKKAVIDRPSGVLLITPESIESLMINRSSALSRLFRSLQFVVIDEIHALVGSERGTHLRSLLYRLRRYADNDFRIIGLSATLGDAFEQYKTWLRPSNDREVHKIEGQTSGKRRLFKLHAYEVMAQSVAPSPESPSQNELSSTVKIAVDMYRHFAGKKNLIFANRKSDVEEFADELNALCRAHRRPEEFLVHHGSLSKEIRHFTEREMHSRRPHTTICSSTLELGIDIGNVSAVGQIDPPWSVGSQVQRIGRSGRGENEPQCMRVYIRETQPTANSRLVDRLFPRLLQAIAITELMNQSPRWVEPPTIDQLDFSTLTHQILSMLAETGGAQASELFKQLCSTGAFRAITTSFFSQLLRSLGSREIIEQMPTGNLILAPNGEGLVNHYSFYSAFASGLEFSVFYASHLIGTLPADYLPRPNDHMLFAGKRWQVATIDYERKEIVVRPARGKKAPMFAGVGGEIHGRIRQEMRRVVTEESDYSYLDDTGRRLLSSARHTASQLCLQSCDWIPQSPSHCVWFTWTGSRTQRTLCLLAKSTGLECVDQGIAIEFEESESKVRRAMTGLAKKSIEPLEVAAMVDSKQRRKLDHLVAESLLLQALANDALDVPGALRVIEQQA